MRQGPTILLCLLALGPAAFAGEPAKHEKSKKVAAVQQPAQTLFGRLGRPAKAEVVEELLEEHRGEDTPALLRLAGALGLSGGPAAADGLLELVGDEDAEVRAAAYRAAAQIGLRHAKLRSAVRWALGRRRAAERAAALQALGAVGDGRDVPIALQIAGDDTEAGAVRRAAFKALRKLSGQAKPYRIDRWRVWWASLGQQGPARVTQAIQTFQNDPAMRDVAAGILGRLAWLRLDVVERHVVDWLGDEDPRVRAAAIRIAGATRSSRLVDDLTRVVGDSGEEALVRASAEAALAKLGALAPKELPRVPSPVKR